MSHKLFLSGHTQQSDSVKAPAGQDSSNILVILDSKVSAPSSLIAGIAADSHVAVLDETQDGVAQITALLQQHRHVAQVHLISHGAPGCLYLGNGELSLDTLEVQREELRGWFADADQAPSLLIYGCNVAAGDAGSEFLEKLHGLTGAAIAASKTRTGNADEGGDWNLEVTLGEPVVELAIAPEVQASYAGVFGPDDPINTDDYNALRAFYQSTGGANWTNNTGWSSWDFTSETPPTEAVVSTWVGVGLGDNPEDSASLGRVVSLAFGDLEDPNNTNGERINGNNLVGTLPAELGLLAELRELKVGRNQLSGPIPAELGNLDKLFTLWLNNNQLTGSIPANLGNADSLFWFRAHENQLSGEIPTELGNAANLEIIQLFNNQLEGPVPASLGSLPKLTTLSLNDNLLTGNLPNELTNLSDTISTFSIARNKLSGDLTPEILQFLSALTNKINEADPPGNPSFQANVNSVPFFVEELTDRSITDGQPISFLVNVGDIDRASNADPASLTVTASSNDDQIATVVAQRETANDPSAPDSAWRITITPASNVNNIATISLTVGDGSDQNNPDIDTGDFNQTENFEIIVGNVATAPSITQNALTITEGETIVLTAQNLAATDPNDREPDELTFTASGVSGGQFEFVAAPGVAITSFTQEDVNDGKVQFVHDGGDVAPAYSVTVTDTQQLVSPPIAVQPAFTPVNDAPTAVELQNGVPSAPANQDTTNGFKLADVAVTDPDGGTLAFTVTGTGAEFFEVVTPAGSNTPILQVKPGTTLTENDTFSLTVNVDDTTIGDPNSVEVSSQPFAFAVGEPVAPVPDDFNGDRISDVLYRNATTGVNTLVLSDPANVSTPTLATFGPFIQNDKWQIQGVGNFDGNNVADIVWRNTATGANVLWLGGSAQGTTAAVGNAVRLKSITDKNWTIKGTGDFNNDDLSDILWYNGETDQIVVWYTSSSELNAVNAQTLSVGDISALTLEATGDFNSDGSYDLLFSDAQGNLSIQFMNGATASGGLQNVIDGAEGPQLSKPAGTETIGTGSINLGQISQNFIAFRSADGSTNTAWFMNGATRTNEGTLPGDTALSQFDSAWQAIV